MGKNGSSLTNLIALRMLCNIPWFFGKSEMIKYRRTLGFLEFNMCTHSFSSFFVKPELWYIHELLFLVESCAKQNYFAPFVLFKSQVSGEGVLGWLSVCAAVLPWKCSPPTGAVPAEGFGHCWASPQRLKSWFLSSSEQPQYMSRAASSTQLVPSYMLT